MEILRAKVAELIKTFPIGIYAGRKVEVVMNDTEPTSYYIPEEDKIVISYSIIEEGLKCAVVDETYTEETAIRSMLYHELAHAILTPKNLMYFARTEEDRNVFNIFEDERIETILKNFFMDTNFKKQVLYINGGTISEPTTEMQKFYNLVRFRLYGDTEFAVRVNEIIKKHCKLNAVTTDTYSIRKYAEDIMRLYRDFIKSSDKESAEEKVERESAEKEMKKSTCSSGSAMDNNDKKNSGKSKSESTDGEKSEKETKEDGKGGIPIKANATNSADDVLSADEIKKMIKKVFTDIADEKVYNSLNTIISQFNKKNKGGSGMLTYSGIINPHNCSRNDYRFFERSCTVNGNNRFGSLHLNLFLDNSGSFSGNDEATNKIIKALTKIESINKNFTFDVYFVAEGIQHAETKSERFIHSTKGNWLIHDIFEVFKKAQSPNSYNYNIVLFDGDAFSNDVCTEIRKKQTLKDKKNFRAFDTINTTIISDDYNKKYIDGVVKTAKVVYSKSYVSELSNHIIKALSQGFR